MKVDLYNQKKEQVGTIEVSDRVFGARWNPSLVHQVLVAEEANKRRPWAHAKGRSEVRGGGRKPWRQKGTGRARHGSIRSPLWRGGGKAHGPQKERDYSQKINKKMKQAALFSVLSKKFTEHEVSFLDTFHIDKIKTKILAEMLHVFLQMQKKDKKYNALLLLNPEERGVARAASNLPYVRAISPKMLGVHDVLTYKNIVIGKDAATVIGSHYRAGEK